MLGVHGALQRLQAGGHGQSRGGFSPCEELLLLELELLLLLLLLLVLVLLVLVVCI